MTKYDDKILRKNPERLIDDLNVVSIFHSQKFQKSRGQLENSHKFYVTRFSLIFMSFWRRKQEKFSRVSLENKKEQSNVSHLKWSNNNVILWFSWCCKNRSVFLKTSVEKRKAETRRNKTLCAHFEQIHSSIQSMCNAYMWHGTRVRASRLRADQLEKKNYVNLNWTHKWNHICVVTW